MGRKAASAGSSASRSAQCPSTTPASMQPTSMIRAKTCASGRNSSVPASSGPGEGHQRAEERVAHGGQQVLVGKLAALGPPGGARGVDDGGQVGSLGRRGSRGDRPGRRPRTPASVSESSDAASDRRVDPPDVLERRTRSRNPSMACLEGGRLDEAGPCARVAEDPLGLFRRGRFVDRHDDRARRPDGVVDQRPLVPGMRHQGHPVPGLDAGRDQALGQRGDLVPELAGRYVRPLPGRARGPWGPGRRSITACGCSAARRKTAWARFAVAGIWARAGMLYSSHGTSIKVDTRQCPIQKFALTGQA